MNTKFLLFAGLAAGLTLQLCPTAMANSITTIANASPNVVIPDGSLVGVASQITLNSPISGITGVTVTVDVTGDPDAYNSDYYAYLQYGPDLVVLLNSDGSSGNGMNVIFSSSAANNISSAPVGSPLTGTYAPVGNLNSFNGLNPNGVWTLFIADTSAGDFGKLASWSLDVTGVPDSGGTLMLLSMGVGFLGLCSMRQFCPTPVSRG